MAYELRDFDDIIDMVMEELKYQSTDTTALNRIKRDINAIYKDEVAPFKRWAWLSGHTKVQHKAYYNAGTATVTPESTTVTLSVAPAVGTGSRLGYLFAVDGFDEIYTISAHTAGDTTITLSSQYNGAASTTATFKIWTDTIALPTDCKETVEVWQDFYRSTLEAKGLQAFRSIVRESPMSAAKPAYYHTYDYYDPTSGTAETESDRYRVLKIHPSLVSDTITLHVDYIKEVESLDLDADEPVMPMEDRIVLVYGALSRAWSRERNPEEALRNERLFKEKLDRMAGKVEDGFDKPQLTPDNLYVRKKRGPRAGARHRGMGATGGGSNSYTSPSYITNATIGPGNTLTSNLAVSSGITIDGVDISALSAEVDALQALPSAYMFVGNASGVATPVAISGDITVSNTGAVAIAPLIIENADISNSAAISRSKLATGTAYRVLANTSAGVASENAALTAAHVVYADANGQLAGEAALSPVRGGTGIANNAAATLTRSGNHALTLTTTNTTDVTLPTTGTLATLAGSEVLTNKTLSGNTATNLISGSGTLTLNTSGTATVPNATDTLVGKATSDVFTNKTFDADGTGNSITNIENADIKAAAAIAVNKLAALTASKAVVSDGSGFISSATTTSTEIGYVNGVTSAIQTQLDAKIPKTLTTTTGDIIYASSANTPARLGVGSNGQVLTLAAGIPSWASAGNKVIQSKSGTYTALITDDVILADTSSAWQLGLPTGVTGKLIKVLKTSVDANALTIDGDGSEQIREGNTTSNNITLYSGGECVELVFTGTVWDVTDRRTNIYIGNETWTDSQTNATTSVYVHRRGRFVKVIGKTTFTGVGTATNCDITVPATYTPDSTIYASPASFNYYPLGEAKFNDTGTTWAEGWVNLSGATTLKLMVGNATVTYFASNNVDITVPHTWANTDTINWEAEWMVANWK